MVYDAYNLTMIDGSGIQPMLQTVNDNLMFGWYGNLALITIGVILFMGMIAYSNNLKKSAGLTTVMCGVFSIMFRMVGLVPDETVVITWVLAGVIVMVNILIPD